MKVLIEYYDKDVLKNIVAPLTLQPDVVVYLHDKGRIVWLCVRKGKNWIDIF